MAVARDALKPRSTGQSVEKDERKLRSPYASVRGNARARKHNGYEAFLPITTHCLESYS